MYSELRTAFDRATAPGQRSVISRWRRDAAGGGMQIVAFHEVTAPRQDGPKMDVKFQVGAGGSELILRLAETVREALNRWCETHGQSKSAALRQARTTHPDAPSADALALFLGFAA